MSLPTDSPFNEERLPRETWDRNPEDRTVRVLGHLYRMTDSMTKVLHYRTDHVRDAFWLCREMESRNLLKPPAGADPEDDIQEYLIGWTFYYGVRDSGTAMGYGDLELMASHNNEVWSVEFLPGRWDDEYRLRIVQVK